MLPRVWGLEGQDCRRTRPPITLLVLFLIVINCDVILLNASMMCPVPEPCHCIGNDVIYCAYKRLTGPPYFLDFYEVWDELNLSDNLISSLENSGFAGIKIRTLDLSRNILESFEVNAFKGIEYLYTLDLSHNHLRVLPKHLFAPIQTLRCLRLRYNRFRFINKDALVDLPGLTELDLSGNELTKVPSDALRPLIGLRKLWLRGNKLKTIQAFAFPHIPLEMLDLGTNDSPVRMDSEALCDLRPTISHTEHNIKEWTGMHTLLLDHNGIAHLDPCVVKLIWTLQKIDLSGNPLRCDCRLYFLKLWGTRTTFPNAQCAEPYLHAGEYFDNLQTHKYNCSKRDVIRNCDTLCQPPTPSTNSADRLCCSLPGASALLAFIILILCMQPL